MKDRTGIPNTCPLIDEVISAVSDLEDKETLVAILEQIRRHNTDLRDFGNEQYYLAEEREEEIDTLKGKVRNLEDDLEYTNKQLKELEEQ